MTRISGTLHENLCIFMTISHSVLFRMINVSEKKIVEKIKTHISCSKLVSFFEDHAVYEIK